MSITIKSNSPSYTIENLVERITILLIQPSMTTGCGLIVKFDISIEFFNCLHFMLSLHLLLMVIFCINNLITKHDLDCGFLSNATKMPYWSGQTLLKMKMQ